MLQALGDNIIVKPVFVKTIGNIILPDGLGIYNQYHGFVYGIVMSIGSKYKYELKEGDNITFQRHEGKKFYYDGEMYLKLKGKWVHGKIEINK